MSAYWHSGKQRERSGCQAWLYRSRGATLKYLVPVSPTRVGEHRARGSGQYMRKCKSKAHHSGGYSVRARISRQGPSASQHAAALSLAHDKRPATRGQD